MPSYKLYYFHGRGRAEPARLMLAAAGLPYEDVRIEFERWPEYKPKMPMGQAPVLDVDGTMICQSVAIARFIAKESATSLSGPKNLLDVVKAVRGEAPLLEEALLARFDADVPPRCLSDDELAARLETLTGENSGFLLDMTGKDLKAHETIVRLAHFLIMAANDAAAPRQPIRSSKAGKTAAQAVANLLDPTDEPPRETLRQPKRQSQPHWRRTQAPNLLDVVKAVRGEAPLLEEALLARFDADVPPRCLSDDELAARLETLTGENSGFLLDMTGKDLKAHETIVRLAHFLIMAANDAAAPRQPIRSSKAGKTAAQAVANLLDPTDEPPRETLRQPKRQSQPHWRRTQAPMNAGMTTPRLQEESTDKYTPLSRWFGNQMNITAI
uniref:glutathione transferase n=1 Tax=Branchiostoma floridae TaxID=7739 RepID=C3XYS8_BRAFL|eukprot:XP_002610953.1 hypothetical protein BRAFLDRAFT_131158 [Branchiostoma floridae]